MDVKELKAMAYDIIAQLNYGQQKLAEVNAEIARLLKEEADKAKVEAPKE